MSVSQEPGKSIMSLTFRAGLNPRTGRGGIRRLLPLLAVLVAGPVTAQVGFVGYWDPIFDEDVDERIPGPPIGDYLGLPVNEAARLRALSWDASLLSVPEHQCKPHPSTYGFRGVGNLRIWESYDPVSQEVVALHTHIRWQEQRRTIWMDGRDHPPPYARHTWQGFSTGHWEGDVLVVYTTHLKAGWIRRNGLAISDRATLTERFYRYGDIMTHVMMVEDPVYLTEPMVKTNGFRFSNSLGMEPYPCDPVVEIDRDAGFVPHYLPGQNPYADEFAETIGVPVELTRGGAETALPEAVEGLQ